MSSVNIKRAIENIRATTTIYTPVVEIIVNAIQAIDEHGRSDGRVLVRVLRSSQFEIDGGRPDVTGFEIQDNGIGFTREHRDSFDTLYTDRRIAEGGKGFGRFICLKYFENLRVNSVYRQGSELKRRSFSMGTDRDIIVHEKVSVSEDMDSGTVVSLTGLKQGPTFEKKLSTVARNIVERLLPYFITQDYACPAILLSESDGSDEIHLNDFVNNEVSGFIREIPIEGNSFTLTAAKNEEEFLVRVFKLYAPRNHKSRISLVAHKREVSGSVLDKYIPEFEEEFYEKNGNSEFDHERNYIIKAYVFGSYLDKNVSLERGEFEFFMENDLLRGIGQVDIEKNAAMIARDAVGPEITLRQERKKERVQSYVDEEAPWYKSILSRIDLAGMRHNPTSEEIETCLQKERFALELSVKQEVAKFLSEENSEKLKESVVEIVGKISRTSKDELIHYVALRRSILDIFEKSLEVDESGAYSPEAVVHNIIFPRTGDTETVSFNKHNLWIVDERLNFTNYVSSDKRLDKENAGRPDLLVYNRRVLFRGDNEASNPITIF